MKHWKVMDEGAGVFALEYSFDEGGSAWSFACRIGEGRLLVISPASRIASAALEELAEKGTVVALVAPNHFHYLGIGGWSKRWPAARSFAPARALARLRKKCPGILFEPLESLRPLLPDSISVFEPPDLKRGETMAWVRGTGGWHWYVNDLICNIREYPSRRVMAFFVWAFIGGTGFRVNRFATRLYVRNKGALRSWFLESLLAHPPVSLVVGHGAPLYGTSLPAELTKVVETGYGRP